MISLKIGGIIVAAFIAGAFIASPELRAYAANTIGSSDIIDESILSQDIKNGEVKSSDIGTSAVTNSKIAPNAVTYSKLNPNSIDGSKIKDERLDMQMFREILLQLNAEVIVTAEGLDGILMGRQAQRLFLMTGSLVTLQSL